MYQIHKKSNLTYQKVCDKCHSVFSFDDEEIYHTRKGSSQVDEFTHVNCPVCKSLLEVNYTDLAGPSLSENLSIMGQIMEDFFSKLSQINPDEEDDEDE